MGSDGPKVIEGRRDGFAGHRLPPVGAHHVRDTLKSEDFGHQLPCTIQIVMW